MIQVYTGEGKGKTTAALGLCLRAIGRNKRAAVVQFLKGRRDTGEFLAQEKTGLEVYLFGRPDFVDPQNLLPADFKLASEGLEFAKKLLATNPPDILVLDEINVALSFGLLKPGDVLELVKSAKTTEIVLTGRNAPKEIIAAADLVTEMREIKHPFRKGVRAREGIEY